MKPIHSGRIIAGKYRLESCCARGGMGSVWQARHLLLDIPLALKFIDPRFADSPEARGRFEREAKTVARLRGTHVAQVHDYGVEDGIPYIVMELLQGEDLSARLGREKRLPLSTAVHIVTQVAKVLRWAHAAGVIHRDLKPGNIFLVPGDEDEEGVKVLDFGVAKTTSRLDLDADRTKPGTIVGSPRYMSPEQARGIQVVDHRTDLWSLGIIAFRMVTGELPFPGEQIGDVILKICTELPPVPSRLVPDVPKEMDRFFARALARDPDKRFQSAREMACAFAAAAGLTPPASLSDSASPAMVRVQRISRSSDIRGLTAGAPAPGAPVAASPASRRPAAIASDRPPPRSARASSASDPDRSLPVERTLRSTIPDEIATVREPRPASSDRPDSGTAHILPAVEPGAVVGARLRWSAAGAAIATTLLGAMLLFSRPDAPAAASAAAPRASEGDACSVLPLDRDPAPAALLATASASSPVSPPLTAPLVTASPSSLAAPQSSAAPLSSARRRLPPTPPRPARGNKAPKVSLGI